MTAVSRFDRVPWIVAAAVLAAQIPIPLLAAGGEGRAWLTVCSVLLFFLATSTHAALRRGPGFALRYLAVAVGAGFAVELLGVHTGWPFGDYIYGGRLGPEIVGVAAVIPLAWAMMAYPALLVGRRWAAVLGLSGTAGAAAAALAGGLTMAGWDLFLDPQMVTEGFWTWAPGGPTLNGIPLTNAAGWLAAATTLVFLVDRIRDPTVAGRTAGPPVSGDPGRLVLFSAHERAAAGQRPGHGDQSTHRRRSWTQVRKTGLVSSRAVATAPRRARGTDGVPMFLLGWTYVSSVLADVAFLGRPAVALAGGLGMGLPVVGLLVAQHRPAGRRRDPRDAVAGRLTALGPTDPEPTAPSTDPPGEGAVDPPGEGAGEASRPAAGRPRSGRPSTARTGATTRTRSAPPAGPDRPSGPDGPPGPDGRSGPDLQAGPDLRSGPDGRTSRDGRPGPAGRSRPQERPRPDTRTGPGRPRR
jgi:putative membrane protein